MSLDITFVLFHNQPGDKAYLSSFSVSTQKLLTCLRTTHLRPRENFRTTSPRADANVDAKSGPARSAVAESYNVIVHFQPVLGAPHLVEHLVVPMLTMYQKFLLLLLTPQIIFPKLPNWFAGDSRGLARPPLRWEMHPHLNP